MRRARKGGPASKTAGAIPLLAILAAVCLYGGFFNAGFGILLLAFLALAGLTDIHAMNGLKLWISSVASSVAVLRFILAGSIDWYFGSIVLVGVVIGGYTAARLAPLVPQRVLRAAIIVYGVVLTALLRVVDLLRLTGRLLLFRLPLHRLSPDLQCIDEALGRCPQADKARAMGVLLLDRRDVLSHRLLLSRQSPGRLRRSDRRRRPCRRDGRGSDG